MSGEAANPVFDTAMAYQRTAALTAAIKLDLFTTIGRQSLTADDIAEKIDASVRGIRILCDFLTVTGFLVKQDQQYSLTHSSAVFLDGSSAFAMGSIVDFVAAPEMISEFFNDPAGYVRRGGAKGLTNVAPDHPIWVRFARAMVPFATAAAKRVAAYVSKMPSRPASILDIAAGHGLYGIEIAKVLPDALVTSVDWPNVLVVAQEHAEAAGTADRFRWLAGNALELNWGKGFDLILLPNFLHHFDASTCIALLRKVKASLAPGGTALAIDLVPNDDRVSPPVPAMFAFWMLASTPGGDAYTAKEFDVMARDSGFAGATVKPLAPTPESLIIFHN